MKKWRNVQFVSFFRLTMEWENSKVYIYNIYKIHIYIYVENRGSERVNLLISNSDSRPIYQQIVEQIKDHILHGKLSSGEALPSMRVLAKELRISVITTKRAYEELEQEGFIETVVGKGSFVSQKNTELLREEQLKQLEGHLTQAVATAKRANIPVEDCMDLMQMLFEEEM